MLIINGIPQTNSQLTVIDTNVDDIEAAVVTEVADIKTVTDNLPDAGAFTTEFVKTAAIKTQADKIGTISNAGGTATIGGALGAVANSSIVTRLGDITTETDKIPGEVTKTTAIQAMTDKIGTVVNTAGTATIGGVFGDFANSSLVTRVGDIQTDTTAITAAVGTVADEENVATLMGRSYEAKRHVHGRNRSYPFITAGITVTGGNNAFEFGSYTEIIPVLANEVDTLTVTDAATSDGNVVIDLNGKKYTCPITIGTTAEVAAELRDLTYGGDEGGGWAISGAGSEVIFTRAGLATTATFNDIGTTGATASIAKTSTGAGVNKPFDIHSIQGGNANVKDTYIFELSSGLAGYEQRIGSIRHTSAAINSSFGNIMTMSTLLPAGTRIVARVATVTGGTDTMVVSLNYHVY